MGLEDGPDQSTARTKDKTNHIEGNVSLFQLTVGAYVPFILLLTNLTSKTNITIISFKVTEILQVFFWFAAVIVILFANFKARFKCRLCTTADCKMEFIKIGPTIQFKFRLCINLRNSVFLARLSGLLVNASCCILYIYLLLAFS